MAIQKIPTKDSTGKLNGWMMPLYKKTDDLFRDYDLRFIYASSIAAGDSKGPHLHLKRECRLVSISGNAVLTVRRNNQYEKIILDADAPEFVVIKAGDPFSISNPGAEDAVVLNLANHIWTIDDQDNHEVEDWSPGEV